MGACTIPGHAHRGQCFPEQPAAEAANLELAKATEGYAATIAQLLKALDVVNENMTVETPEVVRQAVAKALEGRDG